MTPQRFSLHVDDAVLADLRQRLARTRWPDEPPPLQVPPWSTGTPVGYLRGFVEQWQRFDWRAAEARLNAFEQYTVALAGIRLHFIHEPGRGPAPLPLLLSHGWPGSVVEFMRLIPLLTDPARHGDDAADAFTVIAPSLPGYTLSFTPGQPRFGIEEIAEVYAELMGDVLGYPRWGAQGGDWGAFVGTRLAWRYPERLLGLHLNLLAVRREPPQGAASDDERRYAEELQQFLKEETGYQWIQGTRPQTLAFGLTDSPAGLAAWLVEKFQRWTDCRDDDPASAVPLDDLLANLTLYWASGAIGSSFWPYHARMHRPWPIPPGQTIDVPVGYVQFPREILRPPRSLAERTYRDIRRWSVAERGGHFAAMEQPQRLAQEIRDFFRPLRAGFRA